MKKIKKLLTVLMTMIMVFSMGTTAFAAGPEEQTNPEIPIDICPSYYNPSSISFSGSYMDVSRWYDGSYMAAEITASSSVSSNLTVYITAHITGYGDVNWDVKTDGVMHKQDWIYLGTTTGRYVYFEYSCSDPNATISLHNTTYSW